MATNNNAKRDSIRRGSFADHAAEFPESERRYYELKATGILEASAKLKEALELSPAEAAAASARYYELKRVRAHVLATGEIVHVDQYERESELLNARLKDYILSHGGEPIVVEGQPDLIIQTPETLDVDVPALFEHEPDIAYALAARRCLKADVKAARKVLDPEQVSRLNRMAHPLAGTPRLLFAREKGR